jgi:release factor glutamine methyltransferase
VTDELLPLVEVLTRTEAFLRQRGVPSPRLEAELLLCHVLSVERLQLYLSHDRPLTVEELAVLRPLVARRGRREPLSWILGHRAFHDIELLIEPGVLDPRPDTETLVEALLSWLPPEDPGPVYVADVGCGSGAVGLAVAVARPAVRLYAIDIDPTARRVTRRNVEALGLDDRVAVLSGDLLAPVPAARPIDWVVSNPPYIPSRQIDGLQVEVSRHEPRLALDGGPDGLEVIRRLAAETRKRARLGLLLEVGHDQAGRVADVLRRAGFEGIETWNDLSSIPRVVAGRLPDRLPGSGTPW